MKIEFVRYLEKDEGLFSEMHFPSLEHNLLSYFDKKKVKRVYESSQFTKNGEIEWIDVLYKTIQPFYLHVNLLSKSESTLIIYYKPEQLNELIVFIRIMLKQIDNAATIDNGIKTQN